MFFRASPQMDTFAQAVEETEVSRGSVRLKYILAKAILTGEAYNKGGQPYQDFDLLFSLRDALVHMKPERIPLLREDEEPRTDKLIRRLSARAACGSQGPRTKSSWVDRVATHSVARWACNTAADMVASIAAALGDHVRDPALLNVLTGSFSNVVQSGAGDGCSDTS